LGVWVLGCGVWGLGPTPKPPIPNPQSPIPNINVKLMLNSFIIKVILINNEKK